MWSNGLKKLQTSIKNLKYFTNTISSEGFHTNNVKIQKEVRDITKGVKKGTGDCV